MTQPEALSPLPARRVVVGTAGHIDHGKTALVARSPASTRDRCPRRRRRGITIDSASRTSTAGGVQLGVVDVPGHERFVHNMLAGAGRHRPRDAGGRRRRGRDAADARAPRDRAGCSASPRGVVALTKRDLVEPELARSRRARVHRGSRAHKLAGAPILPVSSVTGEGIADLRAALIELAQRVERPTARALRPARLPVDRAFHLRGLGVLVTGTLACGRIAPQGSPGDPARSPRDAGAQRAGARSRPRVCGGRRAHRLQLTGIEQRVGGARRTARGTRRLLDHHQPARSAWTCSRRRRRIIRGCSAACASTSSRVRWWGGCGRSRPATLPPAATR